MLGKEGQHGWLKALLLILCQRVVNAIAAEKRLSGLV
jgi:hypothetical protein